MVPGVTDAPPTAAGGRARALALATACAWALAACAAQPTGPLLLHPVPPAADNYSLAQGATIFSGADFRVAVRPWDYRLVAEEFRRSGEPCPFGDGDEEVGRFLFFKVRFENRSGRTLVFNPMRASLQLEGEAPGNPVENSDLFAFAQEDLAGAEARARAFRRVSYDITATIRHGETLERYLVFPSPESGAKQLALVIDDLWLDAKSYDLRFVFEAFAGK